MPSKKVIIVEDQPLQCELFKLYIQNCERYQIVGTTDNAALVDVYLVGHKVDLILMDIYTAMGESGIEAAQRIKQKYPTIKIIIITSTADYTYIERAKSIGIDSFWYKEAGERELIEIMDLTMAGQSVYPHESPDIALGDISTKALTKIEIEIIKLIARGKGNEEIAEQLSYSYNTIRKYINNILGKTGCKNRTELAVKAVEIGLISS